MTKRRKIQLKLSKIGLPLFNSSTTRKLKWRQNTENFRGRVFLVQRTDEARSCKTTYIVLSPDSACIEVRSRQPPLQLGVAGVFSGNINGTFRFGRKKSSKSSQRRPLPMWVRQPRPHGFSLRCQGKGPGAETNTVMPARVIWKKFLWRGIPVLGSEPSRCLRIVARLTVGLL